MSFLLLDHPVGGELGQEVRTFDVDCDQPVEAGFGSVEYISANIRGDAGVVYEEIQPAKLVPAKLNQLRPIGSSAEVSLTSFGFDLVAAPGCGCVAIGGCFLGCR